MTDHPGIPLTPVVHREREKPRGLDWDALRAKRPEPDESDLPAPPPRPRNGDPYPDRAWTTGYTGRTKLSPADCAEAGRLYDAGWSLPDLGRRYGISHQQLRRRLVEIGVQMRSVSEASRLAWANRERS